MRPRFIAEVAGEMTRFRVAKFGGILRVLRSLVTWGKRTRPPWRDLSGGELALHDPNGGRHDADRRKRRDQPDRVHAERHVCPGGIQSERLRWSLVHVSHQRSPDDVLHAHKRSPALVPLGLGGQRSNLTWGKRTVPGERLRRGRPQGAQARPPVVQHPVEARRARAPLWPTRLKTASFYPAHSARDRLVVVNVAGRRGASIFDDRRSYS